MFRPSAAQEIKNLGIQLDDISAMFHTLDQDGSGEVTLDELCEGFIKMRLAMQGLDRTIAYFRKAFQEADADGSRSLSIDEFQAMLSNPQVIKRLSVLGVPSVEIEVLFEQFQVGGYNEITADQMIAGFMSIRDKGLGESRGVNFLRQVFLEADEDGSNSLTRAEVKRAFCTEKVSQKLKKLQLKQPDWLDIFDALDMDGNGDISWTELSQGMCQLWKDSITESVRGSVAEHVKDAPSSSKIDQQGP